MNACTIVARNYLPFARVLAETFLEHNPQSRFTVLVLDGHEDLDEKVDVIGPYDIGIERSELHRMAMIYDLKELATAVKPWFLRQLASNGATAMYFDPDIAVYAPLEELDVLARTQSIVLTPHTTVPIPDDGCLPDEKMILQAGIYNLGFIGVGAGSEEFLSGGRTAYRGTASSTSSRRCSWISDGSTSSPPCSHMPSSRIQPTTSHTGTSTDASSRRQDLGIASTASRFGSFTSAASSPRPRKF